MKEKNVREIRVSDYHDIYLLNQDFNPNLYLFPEEKVKEKIISPKSDTGSQVLRTTWLYVYQGSKKFYKESQINT